MSTTPRTKVIKPIVEIRRENGRRAIEQAGGGAEMARLTGKSPSFLSQVFGPNPSRSPTRDTLELMEAAMGLESGALDRPSPGFIASHPAEAPTEPLTRVKPQDMAASLDVDMVSDIIRLLGTVMEKEGIAAMPPGKFAEVAAMAIGDAREHNGTPRESYIRSLARLAK